MHRRCRRKTPEWLRSRRRLRRIANAKNKLFGAAGLGNVDLAGLKKLDKRTVRMRLKTSDSTIGGHANDAIAYLILSAILGGEWTKTA